MDKWDEIKNYKTDPPIPIRDEFRCQDCGVWWGLRFLPDKCFCGSTNIKIETKY